MEYRCMYAVDILMRDFNVYMFLCKCVREVKIFLSNYRWGTHSWRRILWKHLTRPPRNSIGARRWWSGSPWPEIPSITPLLAETEQVEGLLPSLAETTIRSVCLLHTLMRTYIHTYIPPRTHTGNSVFFEIFFFSILDQWINVCSYLMFQWGKKNYSIAINEERL